MSRFILLICLIVFSVTDILISQATITIGTGTSTQAMPLGIYYGYERSASIYTSAEVSPPKTIMSLGWYVSATNTATYNAKIYLKKVTASTLSADTWANMISGATLVFDGSIQCNTTGWKTLDLDDPFDYNQDNLLVLCETNYGGTGGGSNPIFRYSTATSMHQIWRQDGSAPTGNGTVNSSRPNIQVTFQLGDMSFVSSTTEQASILRVLPGDTNQEVIRLNVVTDGSTNPISVNSITFNTNGTTASSDITSAKVYYTTSSAFSTATPYGIAVNNPDGSFTVTASKELAYGNNYFWLAYDISGSAVSNNYIDAECTQFTTSEAGELVRIPTVQAPEGNRIIKAAMNGTYTIANSGGDFSTISEAVTSLNEVGISGNVVFNITAGQTFNEPGMINITITGMADKTIIFKKNGEGAKPIIVIPGTSANSEAAIKLSGGDYFTFDGLDLRLAGSGYDRVEYGFYLLGGATGCQNNTIKNCEITMTREILTRGIYTLSGATNTSTRNSDNKFYNNILTDCAYGYYMSGGGSFPDLNLEIGTLDGGESKLVNIERQGIYIEYQQAFNVFGNEITVNSTSAYYYGIYVGNGYENSGNIYSNNIHSLVSNYYSDRTGIGIFVAYGGTISIYKNRVHSSTEPDGRLVGIHAMSPTNINIYKNKIYDLKNESSNWKNIVGIQLDDDINNAYVYNNFIYGLSAPAAPNTVVKGMVFNDYSSNLYIFHNTIFLSFESTNSSNIVSGIYSGTYPNKIDLRNNLIVLKISGTYSKAIAHYRNSTNYTNLSADCDNNIYYAGTPSANNAIFYNGTTYYQTIADYKSALGTKDQNSMTEDVPFVSASDPHIQTGIPTKVKGTGKKITTPYTVNDDIDDEVRNQNFPDIGADAGNFTPIDESGPIIEYTALTNTASLDNRTLSVNIEDLSGVNTTTAKPRIYFKKSTNANTFNDNTNATDGWKFTETSSTASPYEFTIDYSLINGGVVAPAVIQYFIVAQDIVATPNASINSGTPNSAIAGVALVSDNFPVGGTINQYNLIAKLSGTYTVGTGGNYTTLTAAVNDLNTKYLDGHVTFSLIDDSYPNETYPIVFEANSTSSSSNTLTIKPASGKTPVFTGVSNSSSIIKLNGFDYITIDGSNQVDGAEGTDRSLTFENTYTSFSYYSASVWLVGTSAGNGCTNVTIKNCILKAGLASSTYYYGISAGTNAIGAPGFDHDNLTIHNNEIMKCSHGIYVNGSSSAPYNNLTITNNTIGGDASANYVTNHGIRASYCEDVLIKGNTIKNIVAGYSGLAAVVLSTGLKNCTFENNIIRGTRISSGSYGPTALSVAVGSESNLIIRNNVIYSVRGNGNTNPGSNGTAGIRILSGSGIYLYFNSVNLYGNVSRSATADKSAAIYISNSASAITLVNNIFKNTLVNTTGVALAYAIYSDATADKFTSINYNCYYGGDVEGILGFLGTDKNSISDWRTATGKDINSQNVNPYFSDESNLLVPNYSPLKNGGTPIAGITTDYSGNLRNVTNPYIGAYELGYDPPPISWGNIQSPGTYSKGKGTLGFTIYVQAFIDGITSAAGAATDLQAYIGYSTTNDNPSGWTNWTPASFNTQVGNNDEFMAVLGENFPTGTYYYAAKFIYKGNTPVYGGYSTDGGGIWGGSNISGVLTVNDAVITWCNLQSPATVTQTEGSEFTVYGRVYADGVTNLTGEQPGLKAWIGWNYENTNPATWAETQWKEAAFNVEVGNNDEFKADIGKNIQSGTAYFATRYRILTDPYQYGGYSEGGGDIWNGTSFNSGVVTVNEKIISSYPYFEGMEQEIIPPAGWRDASRNWQLASNSYKGNFAIGIDYDLPGTIITNKFIISNNLELNFWWADDDPYLGTPKSSLKEKIDGIEVKPHDYTFFEITTDNGNNWITLDTLSLDDNSSDYYRYNLSLAAYSGQTVQFRFRNVTDETSDAWGFLLDNLKIRKIPAASNSQSLSNYWNIYTFTNTGVKIQYSDNSFEFDLTVDKVTGQPGGSLPGSLTSFAPYYWDFQVDGFLDDGYSCYLVLDLSDISGISDYETIHLLHRDNPNEPWTDMGVPSDVTGAVCTWDNITSFSEFVIAGGPDNPLPVELSSFTATVNKRDITLNWETETEINSSLFIIERENQDKIWNPITDKSGKVVEIKAAGNSHSLKTYSVVDKNLYSGSYNYRLKMVDNDGSFKYSQILSVVIDLPNVYDLSQNYPNPFNPSTIINYQLPKNSRVLLELYTITGEKAATLIDSEIEAGYHKYELNLNKLQLSSGVYFYRIIADDFSSVKKMMILK